MLEGSKRCRRCGEFLPLHQFFSDRNAKDGLTATCKRCAAEKQGKAYFGKRNKDIVVPEGYKRCTHCERVLLKEAFGKCVSKKDGLQSWCNECRQARRDQHRKPKEAIPEGMKRCYKCKQLLPATTEYFSVDKRSPGGLQAACKHCYKAYRIENRERIKRQKHTYYVLNATKLNAASIQRYYAHRDYYREKNRQWYYAHQDWAREYRKAYYAQNREKLLEYGRIRSAERAVKWQQYYRHNIARIKENKRQWVAKNRPLIRTYAKIGKARRRSLKRQLPYKWSVRLWRHCLAYWRNCCCVCESSEHLQADHWIPLSHTSCPGTVVENMIVLCRSCNARKGATMPEIWLIETLGEDAGNRKLAEIQAYFEYVSELEKEGQ